MGAATIFDFTSNRVVSPIRTLFTRRRKGYRFVSENGVEWFLHKMRDPGSRFPYYFSKSSKNSVELPDGYFASMEKTNFPVLRKVAKS